MLSGSVLKSFYRESADYVIQRRFFNKRLSRKTRHEEFARSAHLEHNSRFSRFVRCPQAVCANARKRDQHTENDDKKGIRLVFSNPFSLMVPVVLFAVFRKTFKTLMLLRLVLHQQPDFSAASVLARDSAALRIPAILSLFSMILIYNRKAGLDSPFSVIMSAAPACYSRGVCRLMIVGGVRVGHKSAGTACPASSAHVDEPALHTAKSDSVNFIHIPENPLTNTVARLLCI